MKGSAVSRDIRVHSLDDVLKYYPIVKDVIRLAKKLYDRASPDTRWTVRVLVGGGLALLPTLSTGIVLVILGILPIGLNGDPFRMLGGAFLVSVVFLLTDYPLFNWLRRHIDFSPPRDSE